MFAKRSRRGVGLVIAALLLTVQVALAKSAQPMHIMEGYLPVGWAIFWFVVSIPFWVIGFINVKKIVTEKPETRLLLAMSGAFAFVLSALKIPSVTGSSSHPTGTGLGAILFGPTVMAILGTIVLLFQAILLAHGGLTTLGANAFSMAIVGPLVAAGIWKAFQHKLPKGVVVFLAAAFADWATYVVTSVELALAYPDPTGGFMASFVKFGTVFAITQIPLAISEGILTAIIFDALTENAPAELKLLGMEA